MFHKTTYKLLSLSFLLQFKCLHENSSKIESLLLEIKGQKQVGAFKKPLG